MINSHKSRINKKKPSLHKKATFTCTNYLFLYYIKDAADDVTNRRCQLLFSNNKFHLKSVTNEEEVIKH